MRARRLFTPGPRHRRRLPLALVALGAALSLAIPARAGLAQPGGSSEQLTQSLVALGARYGAASPADQSRVLGYLLALAAARAQVLAGLVESDPGEVLRVTLPAGLRAALPPGVQALVEEEVEVDGTLEVLHADDASGGRYLYHLATAGGRLSLHFAASPPELATGTEVRARGVRLQRALALDSGGSIVPVASVPANTFGEQRVLVMPVSFTDKGPTATEHGDIMQKVDAYYRGNTYGRTWLTWAVTPALAIELSSTVCDHWKLATLAKQAATAAGYAVSNYTRHVFAHPRNACTWSGLGTVGGNPSSAWLNGIFPQSTVGHELGHNFGAYHSHSLACNGPTCTKAEYGDGYDIMGNSGSLGHFNAFQKERLGWLNYPPQDTPPVLTVSGDGEYGIDVYEVAGTSPKALKVLKSTDPSTGRKTWYYVESRASGAVLVHTGTDGSGDSSYLRDLAPDTSATDWVLDFGQSYTDPAAAVTLTATSTGSTGAWVQVTFGPVPCVITNPAVAVSPSATQWVTPGTPVTYGVAVTNRDSASCAPDTFALAVDVPAGWVAAFDPPALSLAPGASGSASLTVTSPADAAAGFYDVRLTATNTADAAFSTSTAVTLSLVSALGVAVSTDQPSYVRNGWVSVTARVWSDQGPAAGASVSFSLVKPGETGASTTASATTDASGTAVLRFRLKPKDPAGQWQVRAVATWNGLTGSGTTGFTVVSQAGLLLESPAGFLLELNQDSFRPGDTMIVTATLTPGATPVVGDAYIVLRLPDGTLLSPQAGGSIASGAVPIATGLTPFPFSGEVLRYTFSGAEPAGTYTWFSALTESGTSNVAGTLAQQAFTFEP